MSYPQQHYPPQAYQQPQYQQPYPQQQFPQQQYQQPYAQKQPQYQYQPPQQQTMGHDQEVDWKTGLCSCGPCNTCMWATCIPCVLSGKTRAREKNEHAGDREADGCCSPSNVCNSDFWWMCLASAFSLPGLFVTIKRNTMRKEHGIDGNGCKDCMVGFFCTCCALIQMDNQVRLAHSPKGPINQQYQAQKPMRS